MAEVCRYRMVWSGIAGMPGVSTFFTAATVTPDTAVGRFRTFFEALKTNLPAGITITYPTIVDELDVEQGTLVNSFTAAAVANTTGVSAASWEAPVGLQVRWETGQVVNGSRLRGRTYLVPMAGGTSTNGQPSSAVLTSTLSAAQALITAFGPDLWVYSRHRPAVTVPKPKPEVLGTWKSVTSCAVPSKFVVLRSRRD